LLRIHLKFTRDPIKDDGENNNVERKKKSIHHTSSSSFLFFPFQCYLDLSVMLLTIEYVLDLSLIGTYTQGWPDWGGVGGVTPPQSWKIFGFSQPKRKFSCVLFRAAKSKFRKPGVHQEKTRS
jgi:hypothetical protein